MESIRRKAADLDVPPVPHICELDNGEPMTCLAGRCQYWITWNGEMTPCGMLTQPVVRPFDEGFVAAWEHLRQLTAPIRLCPECVDCPEQRSCMNCAAVTFAETGRFDGKPEYMCKLNKAYRETVQKLANE
jgi:MoaA/NifB/PqqE/SkfB family radical SAM enzyme